MGQETSPAMALAGSACSTPSLSYLLPACPCNPFFLPRAPGQASPQHSGPHFPKPLALPTAGSVFGIAAALALFYWRHQETLGQTSDRVLKQLGITAAINIAVALFVPNIDNW